MKRIVQFDSAGKAIGVYEDLDKASLTTGIDRGNIIKNLLGFGSKYIKGTYFEWEITNKELREARLRERKNRQALKLKKLEKEFHIK